MYAKSHRIIKPVRSSALRYRRKTLHKLKFQRVTHHQAELQSIAASLTEDFKGISHVTTILADLESAEIGRITKSKWVF